MHIHSIASDGTASAAQILEYAEIHTDLDVIAIADHERIEAAVECQRLAASAAAGWRWSSARRSRPGAGTCWASSCRPG